MRHRAYDHEGADRHSRRFEWVSLTHGDVCVRAMTVSELLQIQDRAQRPKIDPRGGLDPGWSALLQVALSCYDGEDEGARPIWPCSLDLKSLSPIGRLPIQDFTAIIQAVQRVNGMEGSEVDALADFSRASEALISSQ
ncbi:MAG TPA: hypothetical protein VIM84_07850 [Gemmatimonadales bacterium]